LLAQELIQKILIGCDLKMKFEFQYLKLIFAVTVDISQG